MLLTCSFLDFLPVDKINEQVANQSARSSVSSVQEHSQQSMLTQQPQSSIHSQHASRSNTGSPSAAAGNERSGAGNERGSYVPSSTAMSLSRENSMVQMHNENVPKGWNNYAGLELMAGGGAAFWQNYSGKYLKRFAYSS